MSSKKYRRAKLEPQAGGPKAAPSHTSLIDRRKALQIGAGVAAVVAGCGSEDLATTVSEPHDDGGPRRSGGQDAQRDNRAAADAAADRDAAHEPEPTLTPSELLANIDTIVVLMMENRSFDHYLGQLKRDATYPVANKVNGLVGSESNPDSTGRAVTVFQLTNFMPPDPPHDWDACHTQWGEGKNDGFVKAHAGDSERDVMGYYDRTQLQFSYWLADNFTVCDSWFASVMGPTWPNRYYLHATTSSGKKTNSPFLVGGPRTVWEELAANGKTGKNYSAGPAAWFAGGFLGKVFAGVNPIATLDAFFTDAKQGTLPNLCLIDPDFTANDDHPSHDVRLGQAFIASVYKALAASPQWSRCLFVITYDEHGGFFDHVPPPKCADELEDFRQLGFRVPSIVVGPTVRRGHVHSVQLEHSSVAATLATRFGIANLSDRMRGANDLSSTIDPRLVDHPLPPPPSPLAVEPPGQQALTTDGVVSSQPELDRMIATGAIPAHLVDRRTRPERLRAWMRHSERIGVFSGR